MILEGLHEKEIFSDRCPFRIAANKEEDFDYPPHWHNAVEIVYSQKGKCIINVNNIEYTLLERDIFIIAPGDIHSFHIHSSNGKRFFIQFDPNLIYSINGDAASKYYNTQSLFISHEDIFHKDLERNLISILEENDNKNSAYELYFNARFLDIMVILSRNYSLNNSNSLINKPHELTKLESAFEYIDKNYQNKITLSDISHASGFSEYHFSRFFKKATGKNFHNYLSEYRVKKVEKLLFYNSITITEAAYAVGFNSIVTFNRIFKQVKGCSPSEYIKKRI